MQQILQNTSKVIVDQKGGQNLLYLPLDRLMQMTGTGGSITGVDGLPKVTAPEAAPAPAVPETSRRESLRSRDREAGR